MCGKGQNNGLASPAGISGTTTAIVVLASLLLVASAAVFFLSPPPSAADEKWPPELVELAIGVAGHEDWLDALRAWAKLACLKLRPLEPRCDLRSPGSMKKAARQSLAMGKEAVEHTTESAARAAEETIGRTTEKVRRKVSLASRSDGDL